MKATGRTGFGPRSARRRRGGESTKPSGKQALGGNARDAADLRQALEVAKEGVRRRGEADSGREDARSRKGRGAEARGPVASDPRGRGTDASDPDVPAMRQAVADFLRASGVPLSALDAARTPERVAQAWAQDLLRGYATDPAAELTTSEPVPAGGGLVIIRGIEFHSMCVHHLLPFYGHAHVAYLPGLRLAGLSKIARVVDSLARRLQVQERLTDEIVDVLQRGLRPAGAACVIEAEHMCVACRGIRKSGLRVVTSRFAGRLARVGAREEVLRLFSVGGQSR